MKLQFSSRKWHAWISFVLALPILIVSITAILISHAQGFGFRDVRVDASWLPGYSRLPESAPAQPDSPASAPRVDPPTNMTLARVIRDVHSGEALFGRDGKWLWNDIVGGAMTFLGLTGVYLWWRGQRRVLFNRRSQ